MTPKPKVRAPKHLKPATKRWFVQVMETYVLEEHHIKLLTGCCEALDRVTEAREAVVKDGAYLKNRFGDVVKHPGIGVERDGLTTFSRLLRELDLDLEPPKEASRPPALRSIGGGRGNTNAR